ncbi:MAG: carbamoyl phosphate synthase large subunit, partial [Oligoflexia bacterium]|nr:carbamoyl phosphate synthase large subunit [Oligoflexia bacterium]
SAAIVDEMKRQACCIATELGVVGLMNTQFAVTRDSKIYILEVNPRASRTVPFVSKACGIPWAKVAARCMAGISLREQGVKEAPELPYVAVKACVFPFHKFEGVDTILGPEMKSTGEVMGVHSCFPGAFAKSQFAANIQLPVKGKAFLSVLDADKPELLDLAAKLRAAGFTLIATKGTAKFLSQHGLETETVNKVREGSPHIVDALARGEIAVVVNTPEGSGPLLDSRSIRLMANELKVPTYTTMAAALAMADAVKLVQAQNIVQVKSIQDYHRDLFAVDK